MMASLMVGSQDDFITRMVNTLPHITVSDERRNPPPQPAAVLFNAAEFHGLTPEARRRGIKNPLAIMAGLEAWLPGAVAPSAKVQAIIRYANHDVAISVTGIEPRRESKVSELPKQMRGATLNALYRTTNAIVLGDRLAEKIGARIGANITLQTSEGANISAKVVGFFHTGVRQVDETTAYVLTKTGQILAQQTGMINELRVHVNDPMVARAIAARIENETGYKSVSWQEANVGIGNTPLIAREAPGPVVIATAQKEEQRLVGQHEPDQRDSQDKQRVEKQVRVQVISPPGGPCCWHGRPPLLPPGPGLPPASPRAHPD